MGPKLSDSVVKGDFRAFEVSLSDIGPLYFTCYSIFSNLDLIFLLGVSTRIIFTIKKELGLYLCVPGKILLEIWLGKHPRPGKPRKPRDPNKV